MCGGASAEGGDFFDGSGDLLDYDESELSEEDMFRLWGNESFWDDDSEVAEQRRLAFLAPPNSRRMCARALEQLQGSSYKMRYPRSTRTVMVPCMGCYPTRFVKTITHHIK